MTDAHQLVIPGEPVPKERPRFGRKNAYPAQRTVAAEQHIRLLWRKTAAPHFGARPVAVTIDAYRSTARRADVDNLAKTVLDALNGVAYDDDTQILDLHVRKHLRSPDPRTIVHVRELSPAEADQ